jgi:threonine dehydrogenase-like Zn-dependent dehydrogenase
MLEGEADVIVGWNKALVAMSKRRPCSTAAVTATRLSKEIPLKALTYQGAKNVKVENVPEPTIVATDDILLRVTSTAICGSDLHIYRGKIPGMKDGDILGHEFMGVVEETGAGVTNLRKGDRVVVPFVIACGHCFYCNKSLFAGCENTNPQTGAMDGSGAILNKKSATSGAGLFGYSHLYGGYSGGQAEFVRVPKANVGRSRFRTPCRTNRSCSSPTSCPPATRPR